MEKNVALAVVENPGGAFVIDAARAGSGPSGEVTASMVRDFIQKDLARYPDLTDKAAAIQEIVIVTDERISSANYAQDMMRCYVKRMAAGGWAVPDGLHIFETFLGPVKVYVAYGI